MQAAPPGLRLRPLRVTELLDTVFTLYRRNFWLFVAVIAVVEVPYQLVSLLLRLAVAPKGLTTSPGHTLTSAQLAHELHLVVGELVVAGVLLLITAVVVVPLQTAAFTKAVSDRFLDRATAPGICYRFAVRRWGALVVLGLIFLGLVLGATVVVGAVVALLGVVAGTAGVLLGIVLGLAALVAGLVAYARVVISTPSLVLESLRPWPAIRRSWELTADNVGRAFGVVISLILVEFLIGLVLGTLVGVIAAPLGSNSAGGVAVQEVGSLVIAILSAPILATGLTLFYFDLRVRKEAFDLELLARQVLEGPAPG